MSVCCKRTEATISCHALSCAGSYLTEDGGSPVVADVDSAKCSGFHKHLFHGTVLGRKGKTQHVKHVGCRNGGPPGVARSGQASPMAVVVVVVVLAATVQTAANSEELSNWLWALTSFLEAPNRPLSNHKKWSFPAPCAPCALPFEPPGPNSRPTTNCPKTVLLVGGGRVSTIAEWEGASVANRGENAAGTTTCALSKLFFLAKAIFQISLPPRRSCAAACIIPRSTADTRSGAKVGQLSSATSGS